MLISHDIPCNAGHHDFLFFRSTVHVEKYLQVMAEQLNRVARIFYDKLSIDKLKEDGMKMLIIYVNGLEIIPCLSITYIIYEGKYRILIYKSRNFEVNYY